MPWIESHTVLLRHRKVLQLAMDLSLQPVYVLGHLHALWHAVLEQQEDGNLADWPNQMIAQAAAYSGDAEVFVSVLQSRKWLDGKLVHDWMDYAYRYLDAKYRTSNPLKLKAIMNIHKSVSRAVYSRTKDRPKTPHLPNLTRPNLPNQTKRKSVTRTMPENWSITEQMVTYGKQKGMNPLTIEHEFEHCKLHHDKQESTFTEKGWTRQVWQTWVLMWISFGSKQINSSGLLLPKSFQKLETDRQPGQAMPAEVRALIAKAGKDMPPGD